MKNPKFLRLKNQPAVYEEAFYFAGEGAAFERSGLALAVKGAALYGPFFVGVDYGEICIIAGVQLTFVES